ncbi:MAG TPA: hypothetical protein VGD56_11045 [Gemmatirosa sp.]
MPSRVHRAAAVLGLATTLATSSACFHAIVDTGRPASATVIQKPWVNTFIFGLVSNAEIDVTRQCPGGVARVETQQSFLNGVVAAITFGIYTPQTATITCAAPGAALLVPHGATVVAVADDATAAARTAVLRDAATESARTGQPVYVRF